MTGDLTRSSGGNFDVGSRSVPLDGWFRQFQRIAIAQKLNVSKMLDRLSCGSLSSVFSFMTLQFKETLLNLSPSLLVQIVCHSKNAIWAQRVCSNLFLCLSIQIIAWMAKNVSIDGVRYIGILQEALDNPIHSLHKSLT